MRTSRSAEIRDSETPACDEDDRAIRDAWGKLNKPQSTITGQSLAKRSLSEDFTRILPLDLQTHLFGTSFKASSETLSLDGSETTVSPTNGPEMKSDLATLVTRTTIYTLWSPLDPFSSTDTRQSSEDASLSSLSSTAATTTAAATSTSLPPSSQLSLSKGTMVGIVVGVILFCLIALISIIMYRRFVKRSQRVSSGQPLDKRLIGYPYPIPHLSLSLSNPLRDLQPNPQMTQRRSFTMNTEDKKFDNQNNGRIEEEMVQQRVFHSEDPQEHLCLPCGSSALEMGYDENHGSRDTISDILAAYSSGSEYSQDVTKNTGGPSIDMHQ